MRRDGKEERRASTNPHIEHLLTERSQLLSLYLELSRLQPDDISGEDEDLLDEFCQVLVDYIAAGHFSLYDRIVSGTERRQNVAKVAEKIYPTIEETTRVALEFNEKYNSENDVRDHSHLTVNLSKLGEYLTSRIELEDQLINSIISDTSRVPQSRKESSD